ncbi:MAG TPA: uroporphyrinogen-III C-methyltransferase [Vicinamibacterales bacterium]|nr:uroporphyrinogen-III C-methyltransferase [Vicinamibacterales bacterium]
MTSPCVYIVGAGPGDPSLISVRGRRCLQAADVVVYDHRVPVRLLRLARSGAEQIDVGAAAPRATDQDAICFLLAEKARERRAVVRLKWGDPFLFDSGGKEAMFLHEQGIPFEVVPGIPALVGGLAYAGVPVTYPGAGDVVVFVRGHEGESDTTPEVDWGRLAGLPGTLVCYAAVRQIGMIARELLAHGRPAEESAVLIYDATLPSQVTVQGTLGDIASKARDGSPGLLVIGPVAGLRDHLRWFDERPLFGRRIVVTRSREQAGDLIEMLEERGAEAIPAPTIHIAPPEDMGQLDRACAEASSFDWIVFTSAIGVERFMERLLAQTDVRELKGVRLCTVGASTAARLARYGLRVDLTPEEYRAEALAEALRGSGSLRDMRFLLPRADIGRELIADELRAAGADVVEVIAYRTTLGTAEGDGEYDIYRMLLDREIDAVTFTSASTVRNFATIFGREQAADLLRTTVVASIGPVTAEAAQQLDIATTVMPERYTIPDLVDALVVHFAKPAGPAGVAT